MTQNQIQTIEKFLGRLEQRPWNAVHRVFTGFVLAPLYSLWHRENGSPWTVGVFFLAILFMLRLVPAILRHLFPFSDEVQASWKQQRQLAKRYDSYQWSKLFWIGLGMAVYLFLHGQPLHPRAEVILASFCLTAGAGGLLIWRKRTQTDEYLRGSQS
jgi:hypothetical protein